MICFCFWRPHNSLYPPPPYITNRAYKFDKDEKFAAYLNALEVPAGKEAFVKAKWYKKNVVR